MLLLCCRICCLLAPFPQAELFNPRCLFLFGTYTIGKERLFMHVAAALQRKVCIMLFAAADLLPES